MSDIVSAYIERRRETRRLLDHFGGLVYDLCKGLATKHHEPDPVNNLPVLRADRVDEPDGSITVRLQTSNMRTMEFMFQSNGDLRIVQKIADNAISDEYVDIGEQDDGSTIIASETEQMSLHEYVGTWVLAAFEE